MITTSIISAIWSIRVLGFIRNFILRIKIYKGTIQKIKSHNVAPDGKIQRLYEDGKTELIFPNGVKREVRI